MTTLKRVRKKRTKTFFSIFTKDLISVIEKEEGAGVAVFSLSFTSELLVTASEGALTITFSDLSFFSESFFCVSSLCW